MEFIFVLTVGLLAGAVSGIIGTGSSIMLVPVLVWQFGPKEAVPIMAVAAIIGNFSRILAWWREVDWRATAAYSIPAVPMAALGARTLLALPPRAVDLAIALFLLAMIPGRRWLAAHNVKLNLWHMAIIGAVLGFITGIVVTTGPITVPIFLMYGLVKGAFLGTEAASSLSIYIAKVLAFRTLGAMPWDIVRERSHHRRLADGRHVPVEALRDETRRRVVSLHARRFDAIFRPRHVVERIFA